MEYKPLGLYTVSLSNNSPKTHSLIYVIGSFMCSLIINVWQWLIDIEGAIDTKGRKPSNRHTKNGELLIQGLMSSAGLYIGGFILQLLRYGENNVGSKNRSSQTF